MKDDQVVFSLQAKKMALPITIINIAFIYFFYPPTYKDFMCRVKKIKYMILVL